MNDIAISVENLSKLYRIGAKQEKYKTLRDTITNTFTAPFRRLSSVFVGPSSVLSPRSSVLGPRSSVVCNDTIWALKDVSFEVKCGEVIGIIGRNGAGKTTLLKILSRITEPTEGAAEIRGRVGSLLEVGTGFHPELTGLENIYLNGAILGMKKVEIERKFDEIVAFAEVEKFIDTPVKHYSSGMYVRLAFAVAAHLEPEILLVDEVLAVGDVAFQNKCLGKMGDVARKGRTVLFVSHNMAAVRKLCSQAMLLDAGRKVMAGPIDSVVTGYLVTSASEISPVVILPPGSPGAAGAATCLRFFDRDGRPQTQFRLGEPWRIILEFELFKPLTHVIAGIGLANLDSVPIITYWSKPQDLDPGHYSAELECDVPLSSCNIQFAVGLSSYESSFYYIQGIGHVSISQVALGEQPLRSSGTGLLFSMQRPEIRRMEAGSIRR